MLDLKETVSVDGFVVTGYDLVWVEKTLDHLSQVIQCSAAGILVVGVPRAQMTLWRARPVDDLFVGAMQRRLLSSYQACVEPAAAKPDVEVTVYGEALSGPYEPLRSWLAAPILCDRRVVGMLAVAHVLVEAFDSQDLCTLSSLAAQVPALLQGGTAELVRGGGIAPCVSSHQAECGDVFHEQEVRSRVRHYINSICGLARLWQTQRDSELPEVLCQDLDAIAKNAQHIRKLLRR